MKTRRFPSHRLAALLSALLLPLSAGAQVPVDDAGNPIGEFGDPAEAREGAARPVGEEGIPLLETTELETLVGPIALYPDDLLAIVLPASTYPLQVVQAGRFLEALESDPALEPDPDWDDSIVALVNYPEVVDLLNEDLDWTWRLGEAVVAQENDVVRAVERFRNRAYAAGNLQSDGYQSVREDEGIIEITPVSDDIIYVPYYEPERVVYRQPYRAYYYHPTAYPVYYYPYPSSYAFHSGYFWGVTTAFTIGWHSHHLRVFHHSYRGHPYFGRSYWDRWWYRRPTIHVHNHIYVGEQRRSHADHYARGDRWRPSRRQYVRHAERDSYTRSRGYYNRRVGERPGQRLRTQRQIDASRHRLSNVRIVESRDRVSRHAGRDHRRAGQADATRDRVLRRDAGQSVPRRLETRDRQSGARNERRSLPAAGEPTRRIAGAGRRAPAASRENTTRSRVTQPERRPAVRTRPPRQTASPPARSQPAPRVSQPKTRSRAPQRDARQATRGERSAVRSRRR